MAILQHVQKIGDHSNQETRLRDTPSSKPIVAPDSQSPPTARKRKHITLSSHLQTSPSASSGRSKSQSKRQRTSTNSSCHSSTDSSSTSSSWARWDREERWYWNSLSKLRLTSNSLREHNRRIALLRTKALPDGEIKVPREQHYTDITRFARHGGPDLSDIRNFPDLDDLSTVPESMPRNGKGKAKSGQASHPDEEKVNHRSSAYDGNFEQHLADNNVLPPSRAQRAANHAEWQEALTRPRSSPSRRSSASYSSFVRAAEAAKDEAEVMSKVFPRILGSSKHASGENVPFRHIEQITRKIVFPQPDYYQGEVPREGNRTLREKLDKAIVPSKRKDRAFLPTYFVEAKGPDGSYIVARRQACHDGAIGARAMHSLQSFGGSGDYDGKAYTASAIYHGEGDLKLYTHHQTQPRGRGTLEHTHMTPLYAGNLMNDSRSFREGRTAFRNVGDKANEYRVQFINDANRRNRIISPPPPQTLSGPTRQPLSCQAQEVEISSSDTETSENLSEEEDSDDDRRPNGKVLKPKFVTVSPKKLSPKPKSLRPTLRRRRPHESSNSDADDSSEDEKRSRLPRKRQPRPKVITVSPDRHRSKDPSPRRKLRSRR